MESHSSLGCNIGGSWSLKDLEKVYRSELWRIMGEKVTLK